MDQSVIPPGAKHPSLILPRGNSGQGDNVGCDTGSISCGHSGTRTTGVAGGAGPSTVADGGAPAWTTGAGGTNPTAAADGDASAWTAGGSRSAGTDSGASASSMDVVIPDGASASRDNGEVTLEVIPLSSEPITRPKKDLRKNKNKKNKPTSRLAI